LFKFVIALKGHFTVVLFCRFYLAERQLPRGKLKIVVEISLCPCAFLKRPRIT